MVFPDELNRIVVIVGLSVIVSIVVIVPIVTWRSLTNRPIVPEGKKLESATPLYIGIAFFFSFAVASFLTEMPIFGVTFIIMLIICIGLLSAFKKGKV